MLDAGFAYETTDLIINNISAKLRKVKAFLAKNRKKFTYNDWKMIETSSPPADWKYSVR
jgi:hypothetical protein